MKRLLFFFFLSILATGHTQRFELSRAYFSFDGGYRYVGSGFTTHFSDRYVISGTLSHNGVPTGPKYAQGYMAGIFTDYQQLKNSYNNICLLGGLSFNSSRRTMFVLQAGPSLVYAIEYTDIQVHPTVSDEMETVTYTETSTSSVGLIARTDFTFAIGSKAAMNLGVVANMTFLRPIIISPVLGLRFGLMKREETR